MLYSVILCEITFQALQGCGVYKGQVTSLTPCLAEPAAVAGSVFLRKENLYKGLKAAFSLPSMPGKECSAVHCQTFGCFHILGGGISHRGLLPHKFERGPSGPAFQVWPLGRGFRLSDHTRPAPYLQFHDTSGSAELQGLYSGQHTPG